jgi:hypothetical protein
VSPRTLHRQLKEEGATLQGLKDEVRRTRAVELLHRTQRPIKQVAEAAGFENEKSFIRAFRGGGRGSRRRSFGFRPLWMLEELQLPYQLHMLPFPPRALARSFLELNPLGTVPLLVQGDVRMTESAAMCQYLAATHPDAGWMWRPRPGVWRVPELAAHERCDADLSADAGAALWPL